MSSKCTRSYGCCGALYAFASHHWEESVKRLSLAVQVLFGFSLRGEGNWVPYSALLLWPTWAREIPSKGASSSPGVWAKQLSSTTQKHCSAWQCAKASTQHRNHPINQLLSEQLQVSARRKGQPQEKTNFTQQSRIHILMEKTLKDEATTYSEN